MADVLEMSSKSDPVIELSAFDAAAFDLDGVVTQTATLHASSWKRLFDEFLQARAARTGEPFRAFDIDTDYRQHVDGKPRLDGVRDFLKSRGVVLPEGTPDDPPTSETVYALGVRKNALFHELLRRDGVQVFESSVAFIRRMRQAGLKTAVVSASKNTGPILMAAHIEDLFDVRVDGLVAERMGLRGKPWPDTFLYAAETLGVPPARAFGVEDALAGVQAIRAAGYGMVIGVDRVGQAAALVEHGADVATSDLGAVEVHSKVSADRETPRPTVELPATPTADPEWSLVEEGFTLSREHEVESLFAIGNGFVGTRGSLMEGTALSSPATFVAGVFDSDAGVKPGLATVPDWTRISITVEDQPLRLDTGRFLEHRRVLDLRQAIFWREWRQEDAAGRVTRIRGFRLASSADRNLLIQSATFAPENYSGVVSVDVALGDSRTRQTSTGVTLALAAATRFVDSAGRSSIVNHLAVPQSLRVELGASYRMDRVVAVHSSRDSGEPEAAARAHADRAIHTGLAGLIADHRRAWSERWSQSDVRIEGDPAVQRAIRFAVYHLLSAANPQDDRVSIGARGLTGSAYQGHVFWDTEIFMLPFFTLTYPEAARALLMYRYHTLPAARARAERYGWRGAFYAWESADSGEDVTPPFLVQPGGKVARILTGEQEQHISADVAYGVWSYWSATADEQFLIDAGAEILLETARFWASRAQLEEDGLRHIRGVIGPDEYHETVDDSAYTNGMAKWNLVTGERVARLVAERWPERWQALSARLGLHPDEPSEWAAMARDLYTGFDEETGLIEQFRGYFELEDIRPSAFEPRNAPIDMLLGSARVQRSQIIKQADVVMLLHLLWEDYPPEVRAANFRYYEPRCAHGSSLSPSIHALVAARLGDLPLATGYLHQAMDIDLGNNMGNAAGGVHAAALGGLWQAIVFGFAGLRLTDNGPEHRSDLPTPWTSLAFRFKWRGQAHQLDLRGATP